MKSNSQTPKPNSQTPQNDAENMKLHEAIDLFLSDSSLTPEQKKEKEEQKTILMAWLGHFGNPMAAYQVFGREYGEKFHRLVYAVQQMAETTGASFETVQEELFAKLLDEAAFSDNILSVSAPPQTGASEVVRASVKETVCPYAKTISSHPPAALVAKAVSDEAPNLGYLMDQLLNGFSEEDRKILAEDIFAKSDGTSKTKIKPARPITARFIRSLTESGLNPSLEDIQSLLAEKMQIAVLGNDETSSFIRTRETSQVREPRSRLKKTAVK